MVFLRKKGQSTLEYALLFAVIVAGLVTMQLYFKRSQMGRLRAASDDIGEQFSPGQYESDFTTEIHAKRHDKTFATGEVATTGIDEQQDRSGTEAVTSGLDAERGVGGGLF